MNIDTLTSQLINIIIALALILVLLVFLGFVGYLVILWYRWRDRNQKSLELVTIQIAVSHDNEIKIDAMEQVIASFSSISTSPKHKFLQIFHTQPSLSLEIIGTATDIRFYVSTPKKYYEFIEKQIFSIYPGADIQVVDEPNIYSKDGKVEFCWLGIKKSAFYPLKNYKEIATDPLSSIASAMSKLEIGESLAIQLIISPTDGKWSKSGRSFISSTKKSESNPEKASYKVDARQLEAIESKISKPGFETVIRIISCAPTSEIAKTNLSNIKSTFTQFESPWSKLSSRNIRIKYLFMQDFINKYPVVYWDKGKTILSSEEIASIFHLPNKTIEVPKIFWLKFKKAPAPVELPSEGIYIGENDYRGATRQIYITPQDRQRHFYVVGQTGVGKSWLLANMILQDIKAGKGVCFIDPHDTFEMILERIPEDRIDDVIYFDPANTERPMGFNVMEFKTEDQKDFVCGSIINLMYKLYDPNRTGMVGARFEHSVRNIMLTVMTEPGATFIEVFRCLTDPSYVQSLLPKVTDPMVKRYWTDQIANTNEFHKSETLDYIVSKFGRFITNTMVRNIIGQSVSAFDFRKAMDDGKILIVNLSKGILGEEFSNFLGLVLIPKILIAAMSRQDIPEPDRKDFYLYVDEFQNFATPDFATILSEARKYHLNLIVGNQFISQMDEEIKNAIFGNVGSICSFRVGTTDAGFLVRQFQPEFSESDLQNIPMANAYLKTMIKGVPQRPFSVHIPADEIVKHPGNRELAEMIKKLSALKYGSPRAIVEAEIAKRARL